MAAICAECATELAPVLERLGSLLCHDCREVLGGSASPALSRASEAPLPHADVTSA